ncbi:DUF892 family protein [Hyphomicrobium sp. CS1GBMeth3]|uniref:DUF892 family protein n=1 Tax=Hyphomicrobium sp. CS1GBMeth3 TaxID=1892845 RepID=UPI000931C20E|nr:DUF892 family protein [Hyphomicrobium sp. CS1GBMeth3]
MQDFERAYMRTLRHAFDTEKQLFTSCSALAAVTTDAAFGKLLSEIEAQSAAQADRLESIFRLLYLEPQGEPSWVATALLREALECCTLGPETGTQGAAAALLAIKRYEITLYEALLRWSEHCDLVEALADIRRSIAEELVQASALSEMAFERVGADHAALAERSLLH